MSYIDRKQDPRRRANAIVAVGAIHAVLAYVVVTGLGADIVEQLVPQQLIGTQIPLPPPPPEPTPPKPAEPIVQTQVAPLPPIPLPPVQGPTPEVFYEDDHVVVGVATDPRPTLPAPQSSPSFTPRRPVPRNSIAGWISTDDYPREPLVNGIEGSVGYRLVVGTNGRVSSCELTRTSGNRALDNATCRLITSRARFDAATDTTGASVLGTYTGTVSWEIPD